MMAGKRELAPGDFVLVVKNNEQCFPRPVPSSWPIGRVGWVNGADLLIEHTDEQSYLPAHEVVQKEDVFRSGTMTEIRDLRNSLAAQIKPFIKRRNVADNEASLARYVLDDAIRSLVFEPPEAE